jgi:hypothetical protein
LELDRKAMEIAYKYKQPSRISGNVSVTDESYKPETRNTTDAGKNTAGISSPPAGQETYSMKDSDENTTEITSPSGKTAKYNSQYNHNNCLQHKIAVINGYENVELKNLCDEDLQVEGYCLNAIAKRGGENTMDFRETVRAHTTVYVKSFIETEYKITGIKVLKKNNSNNTSNNNLLGTKWKIENVNACDFCIAKTVWEFQNNNQVEITNYFGTGSNEINYMYKYFYDTQDNKWKMYQLNSVNNIMKMSESEERELAFKMGNYFILTILDNKLISTDFTGTKKEYLRIY